MHVQQLFPICQVENAGYSDLLKDYGSAIGFSIVSVCQYYSFIPIEKKYFKNRKCFSKVIK